MSGTIQLSGEATSTKALSAKAQVVGASMWSGAEIDSRRIAGNELFFALPGEHTDGHHFVGAALEAGAAAAVISDRSLLDESRVSGPLISVADVARGLHDLTRAVRHTAPANLVAITGSAGKTTTKEYLAAFLAEDFRTAASPGNFNNLLGFPLSLLAIADDTEWMVAEMGMSEPGELRQVSSLGRPDVAVFTNVRPAHLAGFEGARAPGSDPLRSIAEAKSELLLGLAAGGLIVANASDPWVTWLVHRFRTTIDPSVRVAWFRLAEEARAEPAAEVSRESAWQVGDRELVAEHLEPLLPIGTSFVLTAGLLGTDRSQGAGSPASRSSVSVELPVHGEVNVRNLLAAATAAHAIGIELETIREVAATFEAPSGRGRMCERSGISVIDDTYNANPEATEAALDAARAHYLRAGKRGRCACVLGDMRELGSESERYHRRIGAQAARLLFEPIVTVGIEARATADAAREEGAPTVLSYDTADKAADALAGRSRPGDLWLVKGSRGVALESIVPVLLGEPAGDGDTSTGDTRKEVN